jgi:RNA polymerase sigma factor (sigma-70 family)
MPTRTRTEKEWSEVIPHYEGLVRKTAARYVAFVEEDFEDICAIFRQKVWKALVSFDPERSKMTQDTFVFSCVKNQGKDLVKRSRSEAAKRRRWDTFIEDEAPMRENGNGRGAHDFTRDSFEHQYLQLPSEDVYGRIDEGVLLLPSTLTEVERQVVGLLYLDYMQSEATLMLGISKGIMERTMRSIREKMADWRPSASEVVAVALDDFPAVAPPLAAAA